MVEPSTCPPKPGVELADVVRRFAAKYTSQYHPHVHMLITGGGITADGQHWEPARGEFLAPVGVLSRKIAAKFRDALKAKAPAVFAGIPKSVWQRKWVSFIKHYGHGNDAVLNYLSRYVFRTAISKARILSMDQTHVTFR